MSDERGRREHEPSGIELLRDEMRAGFQAIAKRFDTVDQRFDGIDQRFEAVDRRFDGVDQRFDAMDRRFEAQDQRFDAQDRRFDAQDQRFEVQDQRFEVQDQHLETADRRMDALDARVTQEALDTRRHFDVVAESLRGDLKVVIDQTRATDQKLTRLIASNAAEHAAILDAISDHEVRITSLEKTREEQRRTPDLR